MTSNIASRLKSRRRPILWSLTVVAVAFAGCLAGDDTADGDRPEPPVTSTLAIAPGTWRLVEANGERGSSFAIDVDHPYYYDGPAVVDGVASECVALHDGSAWVPIQTTGFYQFGGVHAGVRTDGEGAFTTVRAANEAGSKGGIGIVWTRGGADAMLLAAHAAEGEGVVSDLTLESEGAGMRLLGEGNYHCLPGIAAFEHGQYTIGPSGSQGTALAHSWTIQNGILLRLEVGADQFGGRLVGPDGTHEIPAGLDDASFCSSTVGEWTLEVPEFRAGGSGRLVVSVLDVNPAILDCPAKSEATTIR